MTGLSSELGGPASRHPERIGPYQIRGVLGRGGMGVVFDAEAPDGAPVALKIVRHADDEARSEAARARFEREARILGGLDHPSVVRLVDAGEVDGVLFLAMERIDGVSLLAVRRRGPVDIGPLVSIGFQLADALAHVHDAGVVHRDIKPANVLVRPDGRPVVTDFGISGLSHATGITRHGDLLGSPGFMAPEIIAGRPPSPASDQFALGRLLFELGARGPAPKLPAGVPLLEILRGALDVDWTRFPTEDRWPDLARVLDRMLEPEPEDRYPSAALARAALTSVLDDALAPDTVSAHVEGLDLHTESAWTVESSPNDILSELDLPAGAQLSDAPAIDPAPPSDPADRAAPLPVELLGPAEPEDARTVLEGAASGSPTQLPETTFDAPAGSRPPDPGQPPEAPADEAAGARPRLTLPPIGRARPGAEPLAAAAPAAPPLDPAPAPAPASSPGLAATPARSGARAPGAAIAPAGTGLTPSPAAAEPPLAARAPEPSPASAQVRRLQKELEQARDAARPRAPWGPILGAAAVALVAGLAVGRWSAPAPRAPVELTLVAPERPAELLAPGAVAPPPAAADVKYGQNLYEMALEQLREGELEVAERSLGICVERARLPGCYRLRGTLRALRGDAAAAHEAFSRYLELAPEAPDAPRIRAILDP